MLQNRSPPRSYGALPLLTKANRLLRPDQTQRRLTNGDRQIIRVRDRALQVSVKRRDATTIETVRKQPQGELGPQYSQSVVYETSGIPHESGIPGVVTAADTMDCIGTTVA
jgi:hypothetical protein